MTEAAATVPALRVEREFEATAQQVFDAWTDPEVMKRWLHADPEWETPVAESDRRVGGATRLVMRRPDGTEEAWTGEYTEFDPPHRVAFTFTWDEGATAAPVPSLVELDFTESDGVTTAVLTQTGFASEESRLNHGRGWNACFDNLDNKALAR